MKEISAIGLDEEAMHGRMLTHRSVGCGGGSNIAQARQRSGDGDEAERVTSGTTGYLRHKGVNTRDERCVKPRVGRTLVAMRAKYGDVSVARKK